jgi:hypothetical protein
MIDAILIGTCAASISLVISVLFWNIRRSRCTAIETPCIKCNRTVMDIKEMQQDVLQFPANLSY